MQGTGRWAGALVDVVSGSFGAGHDAAAREIADRFEARGHTVRTWDVVDLFPLGLGRLLRASYVQQLRRAPGTWGTVLRGLERPGGLSGLTSRALGTTAPGLLRLAADHPDVIVSTHPFASQALGALRAAGRIDVPVATFLTDMSVHRLWVHPAVDVHLAWHPVPAGQARALGGRTAVVAPLACAGGEALPRSRRELGLPSGVPLALVTGGALGIGQLEAAAHDVEATGLARPVVLCGRNAALRHRLDGVAGVTALGWRDDLPAVLRAVDVVVQNAGGFTSQQAIAAGTPLLSYRCLPGHGETNAAALEQAGMALWVRHPAGLGPALDRALSAPRTAGRSAVPALDLVDLLLPGRARVPA
jgi:UDP-N-acetylglucosamine:LPS N-acetylglucosamine transferase